jgi:hypothetical protein
LPASLNDLAVLRTSRVATRNPLPCTSEAIDLRRRLLGREHPLVALTVHNFAASSALRGELQEAAGLSQGSAGSLPAVLW